MSDVDKLSVSMTQKQAELIRDAVESGAYADGSAIVLEALADWSARWEARKGDIGRLRDIWDEGKASGVPLEVDFDDLLAEARAEVTSARKHAG